MGGANAHVVLEEFVPTPVAARDGTPQLVVLSAKNDERLRACASNLAEFLETTQPDLTSLAHTLWIGRDAMEERLAVVTSVSRISAGS